MRQAEFERLYDAYAQGLFAFLVYRTADRALAEDLVADTFERALRARRRFDRRRGGEKAWLYTIALNLLRDHIRRQGAEARAVQRAAVPAGSAEETAAAMARIEDRDSLREALAQLAPEEREAVALRFGADLTVPEMADVLGISLTTAEGRVYRALRKLRADLS